MLSVERLAFENKKEAEVARELFDDVSAQPLLSLLAFKGKRAVGQILLTERQGCLNGCHKLRNFEPNYWVLS